MATACEYGGYRASQAAVGQPDKVQFCHCGGGTQGQLGSQRCIYAYEMQRRGYDVEALPRIFDGTDRLPYGDSPGGWKQVMSGMEQVNMPSHNTIANMDAQMAAWGDGARAIV